MNEKNWKTQQSSRMRSLYVTFQFTMHIQMNNKWIISILILRVGLMIMTNNTEWAYRSIEKLHIRIQIELNTIMTIDSTSTSIIIIIVNTTTHPQKNSNKKSVNSVFNCVANIKSAEVCVQMVWNCSLSDKLNVWLSFDTTNIAFSLLCTATTLLRIVHTYIIRITANLFGYYRFSRCVKIKFNNNNKKTIFSCFSNCFKIGGKMTRFRLFFVFFFFAPTNFAINISVKQKQTK